MKGILELIKLIYGSKALSKVLGTRTNVIRLPDNELKQYTKNDLNIEAASDKLAQKAKADMYELLAEYPQMNDAERLIFDGNLRRLGNKLGVTQKKQGSAADVLEFGTGEKVSPEGIMSLTEKAGQKNPPTTLMGNIESRIKQLEASGEDLSKMKGQTLDEIMGDVASSQQGMRQLEKQGLVRATARDIITSDIKSGKLKLPKELEQQILEGGGEPIDVLRNVYGEDALEVLDSLIPEFSKLRTSTEAEKLARSKFKFEPDVNRPKGSMSPEEAAKAEQENILTPGKTIPADSPEGKKITEALIGKPKAEVVSLPTAEKILSDMRNLGPIDAMKEANKVLKREGPYKNLTDKDIEKIMDDINDHIFGGDLPVDPEDFATGGRVGFSGGKLVKKGIEALAKKIKKPKKEVVPDLTSQEKLYDEYIYYRDELGNFKGSFDDFIIARRKAGSLYAEETPLSNEAIKRKLNATGGRVGFNEGSKLTDYLKTNISAKTSSSSPEEGVKVKQEIIDGIVSLNIPLNKKLKLLGSLNFGKSRAKVDLSELGKKYGIDLDEQVYKDKYLSPGLGAEYITDEGIKFNLMVNPEDKGGSVSVSRSFATGGRVGYADGGSTGLDYLMGIDRKKYANGSLDEFLKSTTLVSPSGKNYDYDFIQSLPQSLSDAINKFGREAVLGKEVGGSGEEPGMYVPGKYTPYYSAMEAESGGGTGLKGEYTFLRDYVLQPKNLVRDYGLEGAKKILNPFRKTITPEPTPAPEIPIAESSPTTSAPVENFINDLVGTGAKEDPILDKYSLFVENYKPTAIPVSNYQTFVDQTGILQPHIQSAFSGLSPFFKQQYQTFATANPEKALEAALQDLKFLTATGNRPSYLQDGGRVGYSDGTKPSAEENTPSQAIINRMIAQIKQMSKMGSDIDTIKEITGASDQMIKDVLGKAFGGSMSKGLDYLIGY
jgi:hypothetical protein